MEGTNFKVTDAELIRFSNEFTGEGGFSYVSGKTIITKEEFITCYNAWVRGEEVETCKDDCSLCANVYSCRKKHI